MNRWTLVQLVGGLIAAVALVALCGPWWAALAVGVSLVALGVAGEAGWL